MVVVNRASIFIILCYCYVGAFFDGITFDNHFPFIYYIYVIKAGLLHSSRGKQLPLSETTWLGGVPFIISKCAPLILGIIVRKEVILFFLAEIINFVKHWRLPT